MGRREILEREKKGKESLLSYKKGIDKSRRI